MRRRPWLTVLAVCLAAPGSLRVFSAAPSSSPGASPTPPAGKSVDFDRDVRPILSENCFACHGPDRGKRKGKLRLDTRDDAFADRGGYHVLVPGKPGEIVEGEDLVLTERDQHPRRQPLECGQIVGDAVLPFDDVQVARECAA